MDMNYCMECGTKLTIKPLKSEGEVPFCERCGTFVFPVFSTACSMIVMNPEQTKILLIKQYGRDDYILVAGYVNKGEDAEDAALRETEDLLTRAYRGSLSLMVSTLTKKQALSREELDELYAILKQAEGDGHA